MKTLVRWGAFFVFIGTCVSLTGCGGGTTMPSSPDAASGGAYSSDTIRPGDKITVQLSGVPDGGYFSEKQVPPNGDISVPLLTQSFHASGKTTAQVGQEIQQAYISQKIYTNPVVSVLAEERFITVGGDVRGPTNVPYRPDLTLIATINSCGGFTEFANKRSVRVIRGKEVFYVDCIKAAATPGADPAVYPGDQIYVPRTAF